MDETARRIGGPFLFPVRPIQIHRMARARKTDLGLLRALDTVRFGDANILNLRESLPTASDAARRAEQWLRQKQVEAVKEVLVVTGRGNNSEDGVSPVREAVARTITSLRRRNVIERYEEHTPGSFSVTLASIRAMIDAPRRRREPTSQARSVLVLSASNERMLRDLAERSLEALGVKQTHEFLEAEMERQLRAIMSAIGEATDKEARLRSALRAALDQTP
jgi:multidrug efflux pump subunit AcrB